MYSSMSSSSSEGSDNDESSVSSSEECNVLDMVKRNDPHTTMLHLGDMNNMTDEELEELGRDIANNTHLKNVNFYDGAVDDHKVSLLFRGLQRSASIKIMHFYENGLSVAGVRSMVPFLQNANKLSYLNLNNKNLLQSEGFNELFRALSNSPIEILNCCNCGIETIEIDSEHIPKHLTTLRLSGNNINADGCQEIVKLLQRENSTITEIHLERNKIDNEGVAILVDALRNNTSLTTLFLKDNMMAIEGAKLFLQLVNDVSSIEATLQSNHTLKRIIVDYGGDDQDLNERIQRHLYNALKINALNANSSWSLPEEAGREKMIQSQLHSAKREELARLQGVHQSLYSEINPLHLPEVLSLVGRHHGQGELYVALKSSIAGVVSTVNRKQCLQQRRAYHRAKLEAIEAEIAAIEAADGDVAQVASESRSSKRRRA
eukprot:scaffold7070_cov73-Skeletonema_dohrnii-CCMP3373.AAC.1